MPDRPCLAYPYLLYKFSLQTARQLGDTHSISNCSHRFQKSPIAKFQWWKAFMQQMASQPRRKQYGFNISASATSNTTPVKEATPKNAKPSVQASLPNKARQAFASTSRPSSLDLKDKARSRSGGVASWFSRQKTLEDSSTKPSPVDQPSKFGSSVVVSQQSNGGNEPRLLTDSREPRNDNLTKDDIQLHTSGPDHEKTPDLKNSLSQAKQSDGDASTWQLSPRWGDISDDEDDSQALTSQTTTNSTDISALSISQKGSQETEKSVSSESPRAEPTDPNHNPVFLTPSRWTNAFQGFKDDCEAGSFTLGSKSQASCPISGWCIQASFIPVLSPVKLQKLTSSCRAQWASCSFGCSKASQLPLRGQIIHGL